MSQRDPVQALIRQPISKDLQAAITRPDPVALQVGATQMLNRDPATVLAASVYGIAHSQPFSPIWTASRNIGMAVIADRLLLRRVESPLACQALEHLMQHAPWSEGEMLAITLFNVLRRPAAYEQLGWQPYLQYIGRVIEIPSSGSNDIAQDAARLAFQKISDARIALSPAERFLAAQNIAIRLPASDAKQSALDIMLFVARTDRKGEIPLDTKRIGLRYASETFTKDTKRLMARRVLETLQHQHPGRTLPIRIEPPAQIYRPTQWHQRLAAAAPGR